MPRWLLAPLLLSATGCAVPCLMQHSYLFTGVVREETSGAPVEGVTVVVDAATAPFEGYDPKQGSAVTDRNGTYTIEIEERFCHTAWIIPPLGTLGGSCMNSVNEVRVRITVANRTRFDGRVPVTGRTEAEGYPFKIDHVLTDVRLKEQKDVSLPGPEVPTTGGSGSSGRGRPEASTAGTPAEGK